MTNRQRILWVDNDGGRIEAFVGRLRDSYDVTVVSTVSEAEIAVAPASPPPSGDGRLFDLVILDVMIPTENAKEEVAYPPDETDDGLCTGLLFYKKMRQQLAGVAVMVFTVRIDKDIKRAFYESGLPQRNFVSKMEVPRWPDFEKRVRELIGAKAS
jgi:CheY-like chemotaxis protein